MTIKDYTTEYIKTDKHSDLMAFLNCDVFSLIYRYKRGTKNKQKTNFAAQQVTCTITELDWLSVVRVEKRDENLQTTMVIADSGDAKPPFSRLSRYNVRFEMIDDIGTLSIFYEGTSPGCHQSQTWCGGDQGRIQEFHWGEEVPK